jgi:hypothetical protein
VAGNVFQLECDRRHRFCQKPSANRSESPMSSGSSSPITLSRAITSAALAGRARGWCCNSESTRVEFLRDFRKVRRRMPRRRFPGERQNPLSSGPGRHSCP